jgi:hypothetical protein
MFINNLDLNRKNKIKYISYGLTRIGVYNIVPVRIKTVNREIYYPVLSFLRRRL